ncbi:MAG TPA: lytic transglycosylase [Syntrophomonas sp.]|jgi:soluble lytic murein transglycosylase|nr:lytic transglycosylase [Syntrophomonas sp.]
MLRLRIGKKLAIVVWATIIFFIIVTLTFPKWITLFYPQPHRTIVFNAAQQYDVDPYLIFSIIRAESGFQTTARSPVGARGLMQIMPETADWIAAQKSIKQFDTADLHDPQVNIEFGCWYLASLNKEFAGRLPIVVAAYNAGSGRVREWILSGQWDGSEQHIESIPFPETRQYVKNVLQNYEAYQAIYK